MRTRARSYRDLRVWQRSVDLVEVVYRLSRELPGDERFGLISQMRRAAVSVAANIAEGNGRAHVREYLHHLSFAHGSVRELETLATIAVRLRFLGSERVRELSVLTDDVGAMLRALIKALRQRERDGVQTTSRLPLPTSRVAGTATRGR